MDFQPPILVHPNVLSPTKTTPQWQMFIWRFFKGCFGTPNILLTFSSSSSCNLIGVHASIIGFKWLKHARKRGMTIFKSY